MRQDEKLLNAAILEIQASKPAADEMKSAGLRIADRLGIDAVNIAANHSIESCGDVLDLFPAYRSGSLSPARSLLIEAHLHDCVDCRRQMKNGSSHAHLDWSAPQPHRVFVWRPRVLGWGLASAFAVLLSASFLYKAYWQVPPGVRAEVQSIDGSAYRIGNGMDRPLAPGDSLADGERIRTGGGAHAVLRLSDGSTIEVNERSVLALGARGKNATITLDDGDMIVQAAKRTAGHLYVKTPDCRVAVTGTVFSVDSGIKGSRVGVLQGSVYVSHAGIDTWVRAGDEVTTNSNLTSVPVEQQIAWSHDRDKYLPVLAQLATLQHRIEQIPFPQPRYTSDLLQRVPADTLFYVSVPNLGDFLSQANQIFHDQIKQSPELQQWWNHGHDRNTADLDALIDNIHSVSQYLGDEVVIVGVNGATGPRFAVLADVKQSGLNDFLKQQFPASSAHFGISVVDSNALESLQKTPERKAGALALVRPNEAVFSNDPAMLKLLNTALATGTSGFAATTFGQQIQAAYGRGAGIILAADLHQMTDLAAKADSKPVRIQDGKNGDQILQASGFADLHYLIAEHREIGGKPENHLSVQFSATRRGVASWLAAPAPIGSLNFVTPNAAVAVAALSKDPKAIADDILAMTAMNKDGQQLAATEAMLGVNFRDDIATSLGGDFLVALDGPVLPTPSWKAVIEVRDTAKLEQALEHLTEAVRNQVRSQDAGLKVHSLSIEASDAGGQRFYAIHDAASGATPAQYTFADGYMIVAPSRALLMEALQTNASGNSLARSAAFRALLPADANVNYSAVAYQNLTPVLGPLLAQFNGQTADALRQISADAHPTAICVRGEQDSIEAASDSRLFGFDFLALETLMKIGNKRADIRVKN